MFQTPFADRIRNEAGIATIAVGAISEADHVNSIIAAGRADLCAIARPHLANPAWTLLESARIGYTAIEPWPQASTAPAKSQLERNLERERGARERRHESTTTPRTPCCAKPANSAPEARAGSGDHAALKLWLRLLATSTHIETDIRRRLRERFGVSLGRFDYMAQLFRYKEGLKHARPLALPDGDRRQHHRPDRRTRTRLDSSPATESPDDRRAWIVRLTPKGRRAFEAMARAHEQWLREMLDGIEPKQMQQLYTQLGALRVQLVLNERSPEDPA